MEEDEKKEGKKRSAPAYIIMARGGAVQHVLAGGVRTHNLLLHTVADERGKKEREIDRGWEQL